MLCTNDQCVWIICTGIAAGQNALYMFQFDNMLYNMLFSVVISYNNVHEFNNSLLTLYEIKALTGMKSEYHGKH